MVGVHLKGAREYRIIILLNKYLFYYIVLINDT